MKEENSNDFKIIPANLPNYHIRIKQNSTAEEAKILSQKMDKNDRLLIAYCLIFESINEYILNFIKANKNN